MAFWSRTRPADVVGAAPVLVPAPRAPDRAEQLTALDRLADEAYREGRIFYPDEAWQLLEEEFPEAGIGEQAHLAAIVATPLGGPVTFPTCLFVTDTHLYAAGNQGGLVSFEHSRLQSVGRVAAGFPRLQVLLMPGPGSDRLELGAFEMAPNKDTGAFWRELSAAVRRARPDLPTHSYGDFDGLGVPPEVRADAR